MTKLQNQKQRQKKKRRERRGQNLAIYPLPPLSLPSSDNLVPKLFTSGSRVTRLGSTLLILFPPDTAAPRAAVSPVSARARVSFGSLKAVIEKDGLFGAAEWEGELERWMGRNDATPGPPSSVIEGIIVGVAGLLALPAAWGVFCCVREWWCRQMVLVMAVVIKIDVDFAGK